MGILDNYPSFSGMNPEAYKIANEMSSYMNYVTDKQKKDYSNMLSSATYQPAATTAASPYEQQVAQLFNTSTPVGSFMNFVQNPNDIPKKIAFGGNK